MTLVLRPTLYCYACSCTHPVYEDKLDELGLLVCNSDKGELHSLDVEKGTESDERVSMDRSR